MISVDTRYVVALVEISTAKIVAGSDFHSLENRFLSNFWGETVAVLEFSSLYNSIQIHVFSIRQVEEGETIPIVESFSLKLNAGK